MSENMGFRPAKIWITRTQPGALATADSVRRLGCEPVVAPLLRVRPLSAVVDLTGVGALAFTSQNAVAAYAGLTDERRRPVFAVGDGTAAAARAVGFGRVFSAGGALGDLVVLLVRLRAMVEGIVLWPAARISAGDLVGRLAERGIAARRLEVYETTPAPIDDRLAGILARPWGMGAVMLHSPRAAERFAELTLGRPPPTPVAICISRAAAERARKVRELRLIVAGEPSERALIRAAQGWIAELRA